ncbi:ABC transporter ATP-binding protein [Psychromonas sp.]|uniref:ABC transporter ATP-binding protein n=1 Tax=Psychromonas sp. TaxID=1884585 RepID=UPI00356AE7CA
MTASIEKIIELKNVGVTYKERKSLFKKEEYQALKDVTFDVYKGETLGIIGRNGAGKSTLLRLLAGIIKPDKGEVIHHTKSVSLMALAAGFDPNLSGRQNAIISGMLIGYSKKQMLANIEEIKRFSELQAFYEKPVKHYSSGMRARLAFSIAMYVSPDVLLIDEVLGVGDVSFKQKAEQALEDKIKSDLTVIIVSHSEDQVKRLSERIVWIDGGKVREQGLPEEVFPQYNLNIRFSTFGLKVEKYEVNDDFIIHLEPLELNGNKFVFNCVIIDKLGRKVDLVSCQADGQDAVVISEPTATPRFGQRYPDNKYAGMARFGGFYFIVGKETSLYYGDNCIFTSKLIFN